MNYFISSRINKGKNCTEHKSVESARNEAKKYIKSSKYFKNYLLANEDLISNVVTALWSAASTYNPAFGGSINTRKRTYVDWEMVKFVNFNASIVKGNKKKSAEEPYYFQKLSSETMEIVDIIHKEVIDKYLLPNERKIMKLMYVDGLSQRETATQLGVAKQNVQEIHRSSIQKIRRYFI
jgi:RNA polymerase sigma factor (sigma-70 family)